MRMARGAVEVTGKEEGSGERVMAAEEEAVVEDCWTRQVDMLFTARVRLRVELGQGRHTENDAVA